MKFREYPARLIVGAYIIHTGLDKWKGDEATADAIHGMAVQAYPIFEQMEPKQFLKLLAAGEMVVGAALVSPFVSATTAGTALSGFSSALLGLYARFPGMRKENSIWPTQQGTAVSKDSWLLAIGLGLIADGVSNRMHEWKASAFHHDERE